MKKFQISNFKFQKKAFSLVEIIVVTAIFSVIFLAVANFGQSIFSFNSNAQKNLSAQTDARRVLKTMIKELRSASPASTGAYTIALAGTSTLTFFSNIDSDAYKEQIRYFLQGNELKKGITKPSGSPLSYNPANEQTTILVRDVRNGTTSIFDYFDSNYTGTSTPLVQPVQLTKIRLVRITLKIEKDPNKSLGPIIVESQVFLRNLKDNL